MIDNKEYARQLRKNAVKDENGVIRVSPELWEEVARIIENSEEVKHGEWQKSQFSGRSGFYSLKDVVCSECGIYSTFPQDNIKHPMSYCPNCGAKMDGGAE